MTIHIKPLDETMPLLHDKEDYSASLPNLHTNTKLLPSPSSPSSSSPSSPPSSSRAATSHEQRTTRATSTTTCTVTLLWSTFIPSLGGFLCGYDQTVMETILALPNFQHHYFYGKHIIGGLNPFDYLTFGYFCMAILGTLYGGLVCDQAGRKRSLIGAFLMFATGTLLDVGCTHSLIFLLGRCFVGFGSGLLMVASPCMITEIAPTDLRGCLVGFFTLLMMAGQMSGYYMMITMGPSISSSMASSSSSKSSSWYFSWSYDWRTPVVLETCLCVMIILVQWQLPDSPRWLAWMYQQYGNGDKSDTDQEGLRALAYLYELDTDDITVQQLWKQLNDDDNHLSVNTVSHYTDFYSSLSQHYSSSGDCDAMGQQQRRSRFLLACGVVMANLMTGCDTLVKNYASAIFYASGLHETNPLTAPGCTSSLALAATAISLGWCVDHLNRKGLLLAGSLALAVCHLTLGGIFQWFTFVDWQTGSVLLLNAHARTIAAACVYLFIVIYAFTWGSVVLVTLSESFLTYDRAKGIALVTCLTWIGRWIFLVACPLYFLISPSLIYILFGCSMLMSCYFVYRWVPNTTAKSLEYIASMLFN